MSLNKSFGNRLDNCQNKTYYNCYRIHRYMYMYTFLYNHHNNCPYMTPNKEHRSFLYNSSHNNHSSLRDNNQQE